MSNWLHTFYPVVIVSLFYAVCGQDFGYDGSEGPTHWGEKYRQCIGKHQSPINIEDHNVETIWLYPMRFEHFGEKPEYAEMKNNGHTVTLTMKMKHPNKMPMISGGPLIGKYEFAQLHFHWGSHDSEGSENTINNSSFPMELHMVFYQKAYGSFDNAVEHPDGLTVLAFLFSNSDKPNKHYEPLEEVLPHLEFVNLTRPLKTMPTLDALTMKNRSVYYTYGGSLTTPPCSEVVTWIEFKNTVPMAHSQIEAFRHLKDEHGNLMSHNFRPTQPLYGRLIRMVFDDQKHYYLVQNEYEKASAVSHCASLVVSLVATVSSLLLTNKYII
ncbi:carbonic anhydrase 2-like isoform X1 [Atheta coriaria]|uniref:carbonic anhydrase 2-like isoform X1 n=2 Tax=Dalotia coriaria TaxID=877792 RepID=UPI0031F3F509